MDNQSLTANSTSSSNAIYTTTNTNITTNANATVNTTYWSDSAQLTVDPYISNSNWLWTY